MIFIIYYLIFSILGFVIGSFLNRCILKIAEDQCIYTPPFHFTEITMGIICTALYIKFGLSYNLIKYIIFFSLMVVIALIDYQTTWIYTKTIIAGVSLCILLTVFDTIAHYSSAQPLLVIIVEAIAPAMLAGVIIATLCALTRAMGYGDAELFFFCGMYLSLLKVLFLLFASFVIGGVVGGTLLLFKHNTREDYIPFAPVVLLAAFVTVLYGDGIIKWYLTMVKT